MLLRILFIALMTLGTHAQAEQANDVAQGIKEEITMPETNLTYAKIKEGILAAINTKDNVTCICCVMFFYKHAIQQLVDTQQITAKQEAELHALLDKMLGINPWLVFFMRLKETIQSGVQTGLTAGTLSTIIIACVASLSPGNYTELEKLATISWSQLGITGLCHAAAWTTIMQTLYYLKDGSNNLTQLLLYSSFAASLYGTGMPTAKLAATALLEAQNYLA